MLVASGSLDAEYTPHLRFETSGQAFEQCGPTANLTAVIDTGLLVSFLYRWCKHFPGCCRLVE